MRGNGKVFISHAHADNARCAPLLAALKAWGVDYWFDTESMDGGDLLSGEVQQAIRERDVFLRICTPAAQSSYWVRLETDAFRGLAARDRAARPDGERVLINLILDPAYEREPFDFAAVFIDASRRPAEQCLPELRRALRLGADDTPLAPASSAEPHSPAVTLDPTQLPPPRYPQYPQNAQPAPAAHSTLPRRFDRVSTMTTAVVVLALVLVSVAGLVFSHASGPKTASPTASVAARATATPSPSPTMGPTPTPTPHLGFAWFADPLKTYVVQYPSGWLPPSTHEDSGSGAPMYFAEFHADATYGAPQVLINASQWGYKQSDDANFGEALGPDWSTRATASSATIGGVVCPRRDLVQSTSGGDLHVAALVCRHGATYAYVITFNSLQANFVRDDDTYFKPMLDSFTFTG